MYKNAKPQMCLLAAVLCSPFGFTFAHQDEQHNSPTTPLPSYASTSQSVQLGKGSYQFNSQPNWLKFDETKPLGATHGDIVIDKQGLLYMSFNSGDKKGIAIFTKDGEYLQQLAGKFNGIHGMQIHEEGGVEYLYVVSNRMGNFSKVTLSGEVLLTIDRNDLEKLTPYYKGEKNVAKLTAVTVGANGDIFIADGYGKHVIHQFDFAGKYIRSFGGIGTDLGKFKQPHGIAIDSRFDKPYLLICNRANQRIEHYDLNGNFVRVISKGLRAPGSVDFYGDDMAVAELRGRVTILNKQHQVITHLGENNEKQQAGKFDVKPELWRSGVFTAPHAVQFDHEGNLFVMDWNKFGRVTKLQRVK